jgi:Na+/melibiose symporter-like transporter
MIVANLLLAAGLLPLLLVDHPGEAPIVYGVMTAQSAIAVFFSAAEAALLPALAPASRRVTANALNGQIRDVGRLTGAAVGGVLAGLGGIRLITIADAATFLAAAALLALIRYRASRPPRTAERRHMLREWREGARIAVSERSLRALVVFVLITGVGEAILSTLMAPFVRDVLHGGPEAYGNIMGVQAIGGLAGGAVITLIAGRIAPRLLLGVGAVAFGLLDLLLFLYPLAGTALWPAVVIMILVGLPGSGDPGRPDDDLPGGDRGPASGSRLRGDHRGARGRDADRNRHRRDGRRRDRDRSDHRDPGPRLLRGGHVCAGGIAKTPPLA